MKEKDLDKVLWITFNQMGIPHNLNGHKYITLAIKKCVDDKTKLEHITKFLYPEIAIEFKTTASRVERSIRHAIEVSWKRGNSKLISNMFGYTISSEYGKPTNTEFISYMCNFVEMFGEDVLNGAYEF